MIHSKPSESFSKSFILWLAQFDSATVFSKMLACCGCSGFYVLDKKQRILYWSPGLEQLSGLKSEELVGKHCTKDFAITENSQNKEVQLKFSHPEGHTSEVKNVVQIFQDKAGAFAGGIGMVFLNTEQVSKIVSPAAQVETPQSFQGILSRSPAMQAVFQIIQNAAETEATVLVRGESGSGKELVARAIHDLSGRQNAPFLAINCAALSSNLLESELFGHMRGAFTGAIKDHSGLFQRARGGTLFLDEIAELPLELQAKLLRVIQERNYIPVGGDRSIDVDVRIVAATHRSLREEVKSGRFREDLMYRLRVVPIFLPPLRERREDISLLIWHFIQQHNGANFRKIEKIEPQAMRVLLDYYWPGNIRELHNVVEYAFAVGRGTVLRLSELPPEFREPHAINQPIQKSEPLSELEESVAIRKALQQSNERVTEAARLLGMSRATFWRKRKFYGL